MITVRKATLSDLNDLVPLFLGYLGFYRRKNVDQLKDKAHSFLKERLENEESIVFIAFEGSKALGFTQLYPMFSSVRMKINWLLNDLFVEIKHRKKGIASMLISSAKDHCKETGFCGILLEKDNLRANPLYIKEEFKIIPNNFYFWENS